MCLCTALAITLPSQLQWDTSTSTGRSAAYSLVCMKYDGALVAGRPSLRKPCTTPHGLPHLRPAAEACDLPGGVALPPPGY